VIRLVNAGGLADRCPLPPSEIGCPETATDARRKIHCTIDFPYDQHCDHGKHYVRRGFVDRWYLLFLLA